MPVHLDTPLGATPLDPDELASLLPRHITTQGELNEWEQLNIVQGEGWARSQRRDLLSEPFLRRLHRQMFGETWRWAGEFRKSDKNIGVDWLRIGVELRQLLDDVRYLVEDASLPPDEIAVRLHHRLGSPFTRSPTAVGGTRAYSPICWSCGWASPASPGAAATWSMPVRRGRPTSPPCRPPTPAITRPCSPLPAVSMRSRLPMAQTLSREHRRILENTAAQARAQAEAGAEKALPALAVGARDAPAHASDAETKLRVRLRAHGRALGDVLRPDNTQAIDHLVTEIAYEHWHRMLFARFLAESDLLMHPDGYPVRLSDCKEDAEDTQLSFDPPARSEWEVAGHYAARMLPNVFRPDSTAMALQLPLETEQALEALLAKLPATMFQADDSLGWSYQFWQAPKKEEVQRQMKQAGTTVGADELPAVTQLFTEQYMVAFLLENALGGWWHRCHPRMKLPVDMPYQRFLPSPSGRGAGGEGISILKHHNIPSEHIAFARQLRTTQTDAEGLLWSLLRNRRLANAKFRRQHPLGPYVLDFYCHEKRLAIELDGGQHNEEAGKAHDARRDSYLAEQGIRVLRVWNNQVLTETESVQEAIWQALHDDRALTPTPLPKGEGLYYTVPTAATSLPHLGSEAGGKHAFLPSPPGRGAGGEGEPAAGTFPAWPETLAQFKLLDPCAGSGHFLVSAFHYLVPMRRATKKLSVRDAIDRVLADNLHGLELDARCVEIAAFALALAAWRYPDEHGKPIGYRPLPRLNIACVGVAPRSRRADWLKLAGGDERLEGGMAALYALFQKAPELGSLIDPMAATRGDLLDAHWQELESRLEQALLTSPSGRGIGGEGASDEQEIEARVAAQGMVQASRILTRKYHLVITNPPYLGAGQHGPVLKDFCEEHYKAAKGDLANVFLERSLKLCAPGGAVSFVMPQNWLFSKGYQKEREHLLKYSTWNLLARLGAGAFETITGEVVNAILITLTHAKPCDKQELRGLDASAPKTPEEKAAILANSADA